MNKNIKLSDPHTIEIVCRYTSHNGYNIIFKYDPNLHPTYMANIRPLANCFSHIIPINTLTRDDKVFVAAAAMTTIERLPLLNIPFKYVLV